MTLRDAVVISYKLSFRYIWIDCLCIAQNDPDEIVLGITNMCRTYGQAALVLSATSAKSSEQGILHTIRIPEAEAEQYQIYYACPDGSQGSVIVYEYPNEERLRSDPIEYRAWCLQEHLLAPRVLRFGNLAVSYICREDFSRYGHAQHSPRDTADDINMFLQPIPLFRMIHSSEHDEKKWRRLYEHLLKKYTSRKLTLATDRLPALAGIAELFHDVRSDDYLAGLWRKDLPNDLMWQCDDKVAFRIHGQPFWSWYSLKGTVSQN
jgi:Heterokaryon incompatibility protein (HET)